MRFAILGSGAVGGYFGAKLANAGQDVTFIARGAHLEAIRAKGLAVQSAKLGDFVARAAAESDTARVGPVDVVIVSVKAYDNATALPMLKPLVGPETVVLTLQNGVDSVDEVAAVTGDHHVLGGTTYVATALEAPGLIVQTGVHRSIIFGEVFGDHRPRHRARAGDRRRAGLRRHPGDGGARRARADLGQVRLPCGILRLHRRSAAADRRDLETPARARDVLRRLARDRGDCQGRRRHDFAEPVRHAARVHGQHSAHARGPRC